MIDVYIPIRLVQIKLRAVGRQGRNDSGIFFIHKTMTYKVGMITLSADAVDERIDRLRNGLVDTRPENHLVDLKGGASCCLLVAGPTPRDAYRKLVVQRDALVLPMADEVKAHRILKGGSRPPPVRHDGKLDAPLAASVLRSRGNFGEEGATDVFMTFGVLEWSGDRTQGKRVSSPLLLVPVTLSRADDPRSIVVKVSGEPFTNPTLAHMLKDVPSLSLPQLPLDGQDIDGFLDDARTTFSIPGWEVTPALHLDSFDLPDLRLYEELGQYRDLIVAHPIIRALAYGRDGPGVFASSPSPEEGGSGFSVLDADLSQREAVALAVAGTSFVLQGPPGTGKSQTIANMISEEIARGRTVLFVSKKKAALETVRTRLEGHGLERYCLEIYDPGQEAREVADELSRCLSPDPPTAVPPFDEKELERCRAELDGYRDALHQIRDGLGISFYEVLSGLSSLRSIPEVPMGFPGLERMGANYLGSLQPLVEDIGRYAPVLAMADKHPWADCEVEKWQLSSQSEILRRLSDLKLSRTRLEDALGGLCQEYDLPLPRDLKGTKDLIEHLRVINLTHYPEESWLTDDPSPLNELVRDIRESYKDRLERMTWVHQMYREEVLDLDLKGMQERFLNEDRKMTTRLFDPAYHRDVKALDDLKRGPRKLKYAQVCSELNELVEASEVASRVKRMEEECSERLGKHFQGERTDWNKTLEAIQWTKEYFDRFGTPSSPGVSRLLCSGPEVLVGLKTKLDAVGESSLRVANAVSAVRERFDLSSLMDGRTVDEVSFEEMNDWAQRHLDNATSFQEWTEAVRVRREAGERGLGDLLYLASNGDLSPQHLWEGVRKRFLTLWRDRLMARDDRLRLFDRDRCERTVARFAELDRTDVELAAFRVRSAMDRRRNEAPNLSSGHEGHLVLGGGVNGGADGNPLRELFSRALDPILAMKPCLMMTPRSMIDLLDPATTLFDLAIIDEASQVRAEDGIATILRAKQVVVVGDSMQVPPSVPAHEAEEACSSPARESILDVCSTALPQRSLAWHCRSQQESLFAFSNHHFYGGRLVTFPSAQLDRDDLGVTFHHVPGAQGAGGRSGCDEDEARMVVDLVIDGLTRHPRESVGVVALTDEQHMAIVRELEHRTVQRPSISSLLGDGKGERFFVKTLENVQGDVGDVIVLSMGLHKDGSGMFSPSLGALNIARDQRCLNVAMTRARKHLMVVSSLLPEEIPQDPSGENVLRDFLTYAAWPEHDGGAMVAPSPPDPLVEEVRSRLEERGLKVETNIGRSSVRVDLAVVDDVRPCRYLLGIVTDGPSYDRAGPARDRERLREELLSKRGWNLHRLWSQDWSRDPEGETERIVAASERYRAEAAAKEAEEEMRPLEVLVASLAVEDMAAASDEPVALSLQDEIENVGWDAMTSEAEVCDDDRTTSGEGSRMVFGGHLPRPADEMGPVYAAEKEATEAVTRPSEALEEEGVVVLPEQPREVCPLYIVARIHEDPSLVYLYSTDQERGMLEAVSKVVTEEGPVHRGVLRDRVKELVAVTTGKRPYTVDREIKPAISSLERYKRIRVEGDFLWPGDLVSARPRRCYAPRRDVEYVSDAELEAMVMMILAKDPSSRMRRIVNDVSDLLGYKRSTKAIRKRIERSVDIIEMRRELAEGDEAEGRSVSRPGVPEDVREEACP